MRKNSIYINNFFRTENIIVLFVFVIGILNARNYFILLGYDNIERILTYIYYILLAFSFTIVFIEIGTQKKKIHKPFFIYWIVIIIAILLKLFILFVQFPGSFMPNGYNFVYLINFISAIAILFVIINGVQNIELLKKCVFALAIGLFSSAMIPLILFPEMIGKREIIVNNITFSGGFWNVGVVGFISIGWILVAMSINEKNKAKKNILLFMTIIICLVGLAGLSRAILLAITLSLVVYLLVSRKVKQLVIVITIAIASVIAIMYLFNDISTNLMLRLEGGINIEEEARTQIWISYLTNIPDYFWFGEITGDFTKYTNWIFGPHSTPLNWFVQFGILGITGFIMLLLGTFKSIKYIVKVNSKSLSAPLYAWLFAYISVSFMNETGFNQYAIFCGFGFIYSWGIISYNRYKNA